MAPSFVQTFAMCKIFVCTMIFAGYWALTESTRVDPSVKTDFVRV